MENGVSSNLRSPGGADRNSSGIFYVLKDLSSYTLSMVVCSTPHALSPDAPILILLVLMLLVLVLLVYKAKKYIEKSSITGGIFNRSLSTIAFLTTYIKETVLDP